VIQSPKRPRIHQRVNIFVTGGTGYIGRPLIEWLIQDGHTVRALARQRSAVKLPAGCIPIIGDALDAASYQDKVSPTDTFIHLVGVAHPGPGKAQQFRDVDLKSIECAVTAAAWAGVRHFVYVSVAHPAPVMKPYIEVRMRGEELIGQAGINATIVRPWYVLGPGHWWPYTLLPLYTLLEAIPATRDGVRRLGLVTHREMVQALRFAAENPVSGMEIMNVEEIRRRGRATAARYQRQGADARKPGT
jgi:nucleoside-diphosphate-sugar epimerase